MGLPQITMTGRLTADPELRFTGNGTAVANLTIATNDRIKRGDQWEDGPACFLKCAVWAAKGEAAADQLRKGALVTVTGRLTQRDYETSDGGKRTTYEVKVEEVASVVTASKAAGRGAGWDSQPSTDPWAEQPQAFTPPF